MRFNLISLAWRAAATIVFASALACGAAAQTHEFKLGAFVTLSGPGGDLGAQMKAGIEAAVERETQNFTVGGKPMTIRVIWYDDEGKGDVGLSVVTRALTVDKINAAVGFNSTDIVGRVMGEFQRASVPFIIAAAAGTNLGRKISSDKMQYVFQLSPTAKDLAPSLVNAVLAHSKPKKVANIFFNIDSGREISSMARDWLASKYPEAKVVAEEFPPLGATDFTAIFSKIKSLGVDTIISDIYGSSAPIFFQQYNEMRVPALIAHIGTSVSSDSFVKDNGKLMEGSLINIRWIPGNYTPVTKPMIDAYMKKMKGNTPTTFAVQAFDSALVMLEAVKQAGSIDPAAIAKALEAGTYMGGWGMRKFSSLAQGHGMPIDAVVAQIQKGVKVPIYPASVQAEQKSTYQPVPPYSWESK